MSVSSKNINIKYVSGKVKTVKWKPPTSNFEDVNVFVNGTWDDEDNNNISVWQLSERDRDPTLLQEIFLHHDVNSIQYVTRSILAVGLSNGSIHLYEHDSSNHLEHKHIWEHCHLIKSGPVGCTALASHGDQVASVGEDGNLVILNPFKKNPIRIIESGGGYSEYGVVFVKAAEVLTGGLQGHLRLWDLRASQSSKATLISPDYVSINHLAGHPTQQHIVAAGGEDGALTLWDMRSISQPFALISAHDGPVNEVQFHPSRSDHLFTCGADGQILHWNASTSNKTNNKESLNNIWLSDEVAQGAVDAVSLLPSSVLPLNSLNIESQVLLVGSDNEAVYIMNNINF